MKNPETEMPPSPLQMWYMMHFKAEKEELQNEHTRLQYQSIIEHKKAAMNKINSEGTTIDAAMEHKLEDEAIKSVCGRQKTLQSGWEIGVGPVFRKKDYWMKLTAESSQQNSSETTEDVKNEVTELKEKLKQSNEKQEIMAELLITKFPEFENKLSTTFASDEAYVSNESSNDCDN
ncbi:hypothetical protein QVD17_08449 [Tagetes erecta]|uniref:Uncharacterized protein n=1 Tax=Tagetes erecta TaxID=13708 RepID=A0AAD8NXL5_TARER|nr:hypothetical protein QVD17_08449 [Tagetes erecta]